MNHGRCQYCGYSLIASWRDCGDGYCSGDCKKAMIRFEIRTQDSTHPSRIIV